LILLAISAVVLRDRIPTRRQIFNAGWTGVLMITFGYSIIFWASSKLPSWMVAVLASTAFLWTYLGECLILKTSRLRVRTMLPLLAGLLSMPLLMGGRWMHGYDISTVAGAAVIMGSLLWSATALALKRANLPPSSVQRAGIQMSASGFLLLCLSAVSGHWQAMHSLNHLWSLKPLLGMSYLIFASSIVAFTAFNWLLKHESASLVASATYINPIIAMVLGIVIIHERCSSLQLLGAVVLLGSVVLIWLQQDTEGTRSKRRFVFVRLGAEKLSQL
jgi:drug/metabolite transporter (DMT)-like permease